MSTVPIFYDHPNSGVTGILGAIGVIIVCTGLVALIINTRMNLWKKGKPDRRPSDAISGLTILIAFITFGTGILTVVDSGINQNIKNAQLQTFIETNYSINLSKGDAGELYNQTFGRFRNELGIQVEYNGKPTTIQLLKYKNGYTLYSEFDPKPLPAEPDSRG